ncbi:MAG: DUF115 domain-containing protein [Crocosphaera sp.]|nr:DUF115 domain-containing protein [Crocosphaera sp.]MDJ0686559.1 DUF115 domain-containing protein [Alphaproteobacteria bacterium]
MFSPALYKRNVAFLDDHFRPALRQALVAPSEAGQPFQTIQVTRAGEPGDINVVDASGNRLYPDPGAHTAARQLVAEFAARPTRVHFPDVLPLHDEKLTSVISRSLFRLDPSETVTAKPPDHHAIVMFGLGMGIELEHLQRSSPSRHIVIIEPIIELLELSFGVLDWRAIGTAHKHVDPRFHFIVGGEADISAQAAIETLRETVFPVLEGTLLFANRFHPMANELASAFEKRSRLLVAYNGWLEDELQHVKNHCAALNQKVTYLASAKRSDEESIAPPALIVGSGPSLDGLIPFIKEKRDHLLVMSCGSALRVLLTHGITPHIHCELENVSPVASVIQLTAREFDLSDITLFASTTVVSGVADPFKHVVYFLRDGLASIGALSVQAHQFLGSGHSVTNSAVALAHAMGCRRLLLAGVDFGAPAVADGAAQSHATGTFYNDDAVTAGSLDKKLENLLWRGAASANMILRTEGNFGGFVKTNETMLHMKTGLESLLLSLHSPKDAAGQRPFQVLNLGSGAMVAGAKPTRADEISFSLESNLGSAYLSRALEQFAVADEANAFRQESKKAVSALALAFLELCHLLETAITGDWKDEAMDNDAALVAVLLRCETVFAETEKQAVGVSAAGMLKGSFYKAAHQIRHTLCVAAIGRIDEARSLFVAFLRRAVYRMCALLLDTTPDTLENLRCAPDGERAFRWLKALRDLVRTEAASHLELEVLDELALQEFVAVLKSLGKEHLVEQVFESLARRFPNEENLTRWAVHIFEVDLESDDLSLLQADPTTNPFLIVADRLSQVDPKTARALELLGIAAFSQRKFERARQCFEQAGLAEGDVARFTQPQAASTLLAGDPNQALALYRSVESSLKDVYPIAFFGLAAYAVGDDPTALEQWENGKALAGRSSVIDLFVQAALERQRPDEKTYSLAPTGPFVPSDGETAARTLFFQECFQIAWVLREQRLANTNTQP